MRRWSETPRDFHAMASFGKKLSLPLDSWTMARAALAYALVLPVRDRRGLEQMRETIEEEGGDSDDGDVVVREE